MTNLVKSMIVCVIVLGSLSVVSMGIIVSTLNNDVEQKNRIEAQVDVRTLYFDKLYKIIQQKTQITKASTEQQKELVEALVQGRSGGFVRLIQESNPESAFSREQFADLSNSVEAQREGFFREQAELVDLVRENHNLHGRVFSGLILTIFSREKIQMPDLITSSVTESVIESGTEDNIDLGL